jgi:hypothetical protein
MKEEILISFDKLKNKFLITRYERAQFQLRY